MENVVKGMLKGYKRKRGCGIFLSVVFEDGSDLSGFQRKLVSVSSGGVSLGEGIFVSEKVYLPVPGFSGSMMDMFVGREVKVAESSVNKILHLCTLIPGGVTFQLGGNG